jgi:hypothetical protein
VQDGNGTGSCHPLYQVKESPCKERKIPKINKGLCSLHDFHSVHELSAQRRKLFKEEVRDTLNSQIVLNGSVYTRAYPKKALEDAYEKFLDKYKSCKTKRVGQTTQTEKRIDDVISYAEPPQSEELMKVKSIKTETSLLSKVKNFFSRKSPQLDSEFIQF